MKATNGGYHRPGEKAVSLKHGPHRCQDSPSVPSSEWANLRPFQTRLVYGKKGVASLPMLNMTGESFLLGNRLGHVQIIDNRMISMMDGKEKPDNQEKVWRMKSTIARTGAGEDRGGDSLR